MPVEGFDDASKSISKRGSARRKASRDAYSKNLQEKGAAREAKKAKAKAAQNEFNKYATPGQKRKSARNSSVNKADVIAKGKSAEAAKQAKKKPTTQESLLNIKNEFVGFKPFEEANKGGNITETITPKARPKVKPLEVKAKKAIEIKTTPAKAPKLVNTTPRPTASAKATAPKKPRTGSDKTANRKYQKELSAYKRKTAEPKANAKPKRRAAKGSRAATLKKGFGY